MAIVIDLGQEEISESLKSKCGEKLRKNQSKSEKSGSKRKDGMTEYIFQESWFKSVKIRITPLTDSKTSVDFKVNYSSRLQEVLVVLTVGAFILISVTSTFHAYNPYSRILTVVLLGALYLAPSHLIKSIVSEISFFLLEKQSKESQIKEESEEDWRSKLDSNKGALWLSGICFVLGLLELIGNGPFTSGFLGLSYQQDFFPLGLKDIGWIFLFIYSFALFRKSKN